MPVVKKSTRASKPKKQEPQQFLFNNIERVPIGSLKPHPRNPRQGDVDSVMASLKEHGQYKPLVVNGRAPLKDVIAAGHHTWLAARKLGWEEIGIVRVNVDEAKHLQIMLIDNKTSDAGTYDDAILAEVLAELAGVEMLDGTGYSVAEFQDLIDTVRTSSEGSSANLEEMLAAMPKTEFKTKSKREEYLEEEEQNEDRAAANTNRGAGKAAKSEDSDEIDDIEGNAEAELQAVLEVKVENVEFWKQCGVDSGDDFEIPSLREDMLMEEIPPGLRTWGGRDATPDDGKSWFLYNYSLGGIKELPFDRTVLAFNCVDTETEALTQRGWVSGHDLIEQDTVLSMDPKTGELKWSQIKSIFRKRYTGKMHRLTGSALDALVTPDHKFATVDGRLVPVQHLKVTDPIRTMGQAESSVSGVYTDAFVELVGWAVTEGHYRIGKRRHSVAIAQKCGSEGEQYIRDAMKRVGVEWSEYNSGTNCVTFSITGPTAHAIIEAAPGKVLSYKFLTELSAYQRNLLIEVMIDGDGWRTGKKSQVYTQKSKEHSDAFVALCAMAGVPTTTTYREWTTAPNGDPITSSVWNTVLKVRKVAQPHNIDWHGGRGDHRRGIPHQPTEDYDDIVWCPETEYGTFICRRNGKVYVTGNTHDAKFEGWWETPAWYTCRVIAKGCRHAIVPDFSFYYTQPRVMHLFNVYRSMWLGRFFQEAGMKVAPRLQFDYKDPNTLDIALRNIPVGCPVLATSQQNIEDEKVDGPKVTKLLKEALDAVKPKSLIYYSGPPGKRAMEATKWKGKVVYLENYVAVRREVAFGKKEGLAAKNSTGRAKILDKARKRLASTAQEPESDDE